MGNISSLVNKEAASTAAMGQQPAVMPANNSNNNKRKASELLLRFGESSAAAEDQHLTITPSKKQRLEQQNHFTVSHVLNDETSGPFTPWGASQS